LLKIVKSVTRYLSFCIYLTLCASVKYKYSSIYSTLDITCF